MNKEVANSYFPLYRAEVFEYFKEEPTKVSDKIDLLVKVNFYEKTDVDGEWNVVVSTDMDNIIVATAYVNLLYHSIKKDGTVVDADIASLSVEGREVGSHFPLRKIDVKEFTYGRDSGCSWSDPENDIRQSVSIEYGLQKAINGVWELDYTQRFNFFDYALIASVRTYYRLLEHIPYEFSAYNQTAKDEDIAMFEYHDYLFKFTSHISDQKCVCGISISGYYNDYEEDTSIKVDYLEDYVFIYNYGQVLLFKQKLYMNAELLISLKELEEKHGITPSNVEWGDDVFKKWLKLNHPEAKSVSTLMSWYGIR